MELRFCVRPNRRRSAFEMAGSSTRECLGLEVEHTMGAREVVGILEKLVAERGAPQFLRSDNGPEFVALEVKEWIQSKGFKTLYIEPGAPWQNSYTESFYEAVESLLGFRSLVIPTLH
jgi:transposase InsO family protein